jgi:predicted secreted protein
MRLLTILVVPTLALALAASAAAGRTIKVGPKANGTSLVLQPSDVLVVSLPGNATTGYAWRVRSVTRSVLQPVGTKYVPHKASGKVGVGGTYVLRFRALRGGVTTLRLVYSQSGSGSVAKTFKLHVTVKTPPPRA